jgi:adenylate cyclase
VRALEEELGVEPSPETEALYETLVADDQQARPGPRTGRPTAGSQGAATDDPMYPEHQEVEVLEPAAAPGAPILPPFLVASEGRGQPPTRVVGREPELLRLSNALDEALAGRGRAVFVTGEAGRGKSSLLGEFTRRAQAAHSELVVVVGHCNGFTGAGDPLLPFRDALEMLTGDVEARVLAGTIDREYAKRLWLLLPRVVGAIAQNGPELLDRFLRRAPLVSRSVQFDPTGRLGELIESAAKSNGGPGDNQAAIFEAYTHVLREVSRDAPVVLLVEDLHWADASSVALLFHLTRRLSGARVLVVGTLRTEELAEDDNVEGQALQRVVAELERVQGASRLDLDASASGRAFIDELLDGEPNGLGADFRGRLAELTEGHPLFVVELLEEMKLEGGLVMDASGKWVEAPDLTWHALPARVEGVIRTRLERLDAELREALQVASVEGPTFNAEVVAAVLGVDARQLTRRLSGEAEKLHQLVEGVELARIGGRRLARFRFRHDLFQRYLYNGLSGLDRTMVHEEVGIALEELHGGDTAAIAVELARHFEEGGLAERATYYLLVAGRQASDLYAFEEAATHLRRGLGLLDAEPTSPELDRLRLDTLLLLGSVMQAVHGYSVPELVETFESARASAASLGATRDEFSAVWSLSLYHSQRADFERAAELGEVLLGLGEREGDERLLLQAHHSIWFARFCLGDFTGVLEHARRGAALYPRHGGEDPSLRTGNHDAGACAHVFAGRALWYLGYPDDAHTECEKALELAAGFSRADSLAHVLAQSAEIQILRGAGELALDLADRCHEVASANGLDFWAGWAMIMRGCALIQLGKVEEGIAVTHKGRSEYPGIGVAEELIVWTRLAEAHATLGQLDEAEACLAAAFEVAERLTAEVWRAELHRLTGAIQALRGRDHDEAARSFERALDIASRHGAKSLELRAAASRREARIS